MASYRISPFGQSGETSGAGGVEVVNDMTTGGVDKALSAEQGKVIKVSIDSLQSNIDAMANIAFINGKPRTGEIDIEVRPQ